MSSPLPYSTIDLLVVGLLDLLDLLDIRFIQAMLGHRDLNTTEIYTRVSIDQLQSIHGATHPLAGNVDGDL